MTNDGWSKTFRAEARKQASGGPRRAHLLVVSDLHFGEILVPGSDHYVRQVAAFNQSFCRFLSYYRENTKDGVPWRLVLAGDTVDFVRAGLSIPQEDSPERAAVLALEHIIEGHPRVFSELAQFVAAGHELVIIKGNHDAEFHWEEVQSTFVRSLEALVDAPLEERIAFCAWFYYEHDLVYIEHGNQYDEYCSYEHVLAPLHDEAASEVPISHYLYVSFHEMLDKLDVHGIENMKLVDYARWLLGLGPRTLARLAYAYVACLGWMVNTRRKFLRKARGTRLLHLRRMRRLAKRFPVTEELLHALDDLRHRPAGLFSSIRMLYMDRMFLLGGFMVASVALLFAPVEWITRVYTLLGAGAVAGLASLALAPYRRVESHPKLRRMARQVARLVKVPYVIFGHTHVPVAESFDEDGHRRWYFNTGSWTGGERLGFTHVRILVTPEPSGALLLWDAELCVPRDASGLSA